MKSLLFSIFLFIVLIPSSYSAINSTITGPSINESYKMNQTYTFIGIALDQNGQYIKKNNFTWTVHLRHDGHWHDNIYATSGDSIFEFTTPVKGELTSIYRFKIDMTTPFSTGKDSTVFVILYPDTSRITFNTTPAGINIKVFGTAFTSNFSFSEVVDGILPISFDTNQTINGEKYRFRNWSFGSTVSNQVFYAPANDTTFSLIFEKVGTTTTTVSAIGGNGKINGLEVYPNPFIEDFIIEGLKGENDIIIYDQLLNKIRYSRIGNSDCTKITLEAPPGLYFMKIQSKDKPSCFYKLIKN